jgi:disulfide bond formation protein DsbB
VKGSKGSPLAGPGQSPGLAYSHTATVGQRLRGVCDRVQMPPMNSRIMALLAALAAGLALGIALISEYWGGLVPCALCLWERWPYRIAIVLGFLGALLPERLARWVLWLLVVSAVVAAFLAAVHVGVEWKLWPSPLPECAAPDLGGLSLAERLARMPARPAKPCDEPTYLIPFLPVSMAMMNFLYAVVFAAAIAWYLRWSHRRMA